MEVAHSTSPLRNSPPRPMSMQDTVQLPPTKSLVPPASAASMTSRFTGSSTMTELSSMRRVEAASIHRPSHPVSRSFRWTSEV